MKFNGVMSAIVTPFSNGEIDFKSLKKHIRHQIDNGVSGLVVAGSTGEAATLSLEEKVKVLKFVVSEVSEQVEVVMGSGTFNTKESCELAAIFEKEKPSGLLVVVPYYSKPPQRGQILHFEKIAQSTKLPIILYNVPSRTAVAMEPSTVGELSRRCKNIVGIKEATGDLVIIEQMKGAVPDDFQILSGDDATFLEAVGAGSRGVISVVSNLAPRWCVDSFGKVKSIKKTDYDLVKLASKLTSELEPLIAAIYCESNPIPVKWALCEMGIIESPELRSPLTTLDPKFENLLRSALKKMKLL